MACPSIRHRALGAAVSTYSLAYVGLARAHALTGDSGKSRKAEVPRHVRACLLLLHLSLKSLAFALVLLRSLARVSRVRSRPFTTPPTALHVPVSSGVEGLSSCSIKDRAPGSAVGFLPVRSKSPIRRLANLWVSEFPLGHVSSRGVCLQQAINRVCNRSRILLMSHALICLRGKRRKRGCFLSSASSASVVFGGSPRR